MKKKKKKKMLTFYVLVKTVKSLSFFPVRKKIEKVNNKGKTFTKAYSARFIDSMGLMNTSLDIHINNLPNKIYNQKCKNCFKCKDCKSKECKMML